MKKILIVSSCTKRRGTIGLVGNLINTLASMDSTKYNITLLDTNFFERNHIPSDYNVDSYNALDKHLWDNIIRKIPKLRAWYAEKQAIKSYKNLIINGHYDMILVYEIPAYADKLVEIAHQYETKIYFEPFGSDILRVTGYVKKRIEKAFSEIDGVIGRKQSNVLIAAQEEYNVPIEKLKEQREFVSGVAILKKLMGKFTRREMHEGIGVPYSDYNIVCGYSGRESHRHRTIIEALIKVKDVLPEGYQIIFPMTYGAGQHHEIIISYAKELKEICDKAGLNTVFMTDFKTAEQMAYLHLITDLFIEIQPTDNGNAFMIEALYAQNQIVTGSWLGYKRFEQFGEPYYLIDEPEKLADKLHEIFSGTIGKAIVPQKLIDFFDVPNDYDSRAFWINLFETI